MAMVLTTGGLSSSAAGTEQFGSQFNPFAVGSRSEHGFLGLSRESERGAREAQGASFLSVVMASTAGLPVEGFELSVLGMPSDSVSAMHASSHMLASLVAAERSLDLRGAEAMSAARKSGDRVAEQQRETGIRQSATTACNARNAQVFPGGSSDLFLLTGRIGATTGAQSIAVACNTLSHVAEDRGIQVTVVDAQLGKGRFFVVGGALDGERIYGILFWLCAEMNGGRLSGDGRMYV